MAAKRTITDDELKALAEKAQDLTGELHYAAETYRMRLGTEGEHGKPTTHARIFTSLARSAADLAQAILVKVAMDEDRRDLERELRARIEKGGGDA